MNKKWLPPHSRPPYERQQHIKKSNLPPGLPSNKEIVLGVAEGRLRKSSVHAFCHLPPLNDEWVKPTNENGRRHYTTNKWVSIMCRVVTWQQTWRNEKSTWPKKSNWVGKGRRHFKGVTRNYRIHYAGYPESAGQQKHPNSGHHVWIRRCRCSSNGHISA